MSEVENNKKDPTYRVLVCYADFFQMKLSALIEICEEIQSNSQMISQEVFKNRIRGLIKKHQRNYKKQEKALESLRTQ